MKKLLARVGPCTIKPRRRYFSTLCSSILSQQLNTQVADIICNRFKEYYSNKVTPQKVLETQDKDLRNLGISFQKISYLKNLSERVESKELALRFSKNQSDEEIINALTEVKGIGRWTAEMFLMFSLARPDVFSVGDLGLRQGLVTFYGLKNREDLKKAYKISLKWAPWRTLASWTLWRGLELEFKG